MQIFAVYSKNGVDFGRAGNKFGSFTLHQTLVVTLICGCMAIVLVLVLVLGVGVRVGVRLATANPNSRK